MTTTLFNLIDFAPPAPAWALECFYCSPDSTGHYDEERHLADHLELTCAICGGVEPNRLLFTQSHGVNLGASWGRDALMCTSLDLCLNHLAYAIKYGEAPAQRDLDLVLPTGWLMGPDGKAVRPAGWPTGLFAYDSFLAMSRERGAVTWW